MCERPPQYDRTGWRGWIDIPMRAAGKPTGDWVDLSYPLGPDAPCASIFRKPRFTRVQCLPVDPFNVTEMQMAVHTGTHVDAPSHYFRDGPAFDAIPLDRLHGPGVIWRIGKAPGATIGPDVLAQCRPQLQPGDILAIDTGWTAQFGSESYDFHPSLTEAAADWLVERRIKLFACDFATPDLVVRLRQPGFEWPVHRALLGHGILICEHLRCPPALSGKRVEFVFNALNIAGADGAPARVLARPVEDAASR
ncbi:MAG: cyclase family protein [Rhodospirillales bacterium]|nr:cyclase family protein [Rhodospirillales bacterium]